MVTVYIFYAITGVPSFLMNLYWMLEFLRRIAKIQKYKRGAARIEERGRLLPHYNFEVRKYIHLISLTLVELIWLFAYFIIILLKSDTNTIPFSSQDYDFRMLNYCRNVNESTVESQSAVSYALNAIWAIGQIQQILSLCISARLMRLLAVKTKFGIYGTSSIVDPTTCLVCAAILIISVIPYTYIVSVLIVSIVIALYFVNFVRSVMILRQSLLQYSFERLVQFRNNSREARQYTWFVCFSTLWGFGSFLIIFSDCLGQILTVLTLLAQGKCYIQSIYHIAYHPVLHSRRQLLLLFKTGKVILITTKVFTVLSSSICAFPMLVVTCATWISIIYRVVNGKNKLKVRYRGSEYLSQELIIKSS